MAKTKKLHLRESAESYLNYGLIATGDSYSSCSLCLICGIQLWNHEAFNSALPSGDQIPCTKDKPLEFFKIKKNQKHEQNQLVKVTSLSNMSAQRALFLVANYIAKAKKFFSISEELILPGAKSILGKATA